MQYLGVADLPREDALADACVVLVEAAVESDLELDAGLADLGERAVDDAEVGVDGLLAEKWPCRRARPR